MQEKAWKIKTYIFLVEKAKIVNVFLKIKIAAAGFLLYPAVYAPGLISVYRYLDNCPNGHHPEKTNPEWIQSRMDTIPNEHDPECTQSRMDTIPNGHNPEWTRSRMDTIPNGHHPEWTQSPMSTYLVTEVFYTQA